MRKQSTTLLLIIFVVTAVVSIGWVLPGGVRQVASFTVSQTTGAPGPATPVDSGDSQVCFEHHAFPETGSPSSRLSAQPVSTTREDYDEASSTGRVASQAASLTLGRKEALLTRRTSTHHRTNRLPNVGAVSTVTTVHLRGTKQLYGLAPVNTPTLTAIVDVPLNRGPTPITSISL